MPIRKRHVSQNSGATAMLTLPRRKLLHLAAGAAALPAASRIAWAQTYPSRPVRLVVGFPAGGVADLFGRLIGQSLSAHLGQPVIIENRVGAGSNLATESVVRAIPDGYTLLYATSSNSYNTVLYDKLNFDFIRDIVPVASVLRGIGVLVRTDAMRQKADVHCALQRSMVWASSG